MLRSSFVNEKTLHSLLCYIILSIDHRRVRLEVKQTKTLTKAAAAAVLEQLIVVVAAATAMAATLTGLSQLIQIWANTHNIKRYHCSITSLLHNRALM
jgi:hypothetical protein